MAKLPIALLLAAFSLSAADLTKLQIVVTNEAGKPVEQAEVIVKFVQGRSATKFGAKIRRKTIRPSARRSTFKKKNGRSK